MRIESRYSLDMNDLREYDGNMFLKNKDESLENKVIFRDFLDTLSKKERKVVYELACGTAVKEILKILKIDIICFKNIIFSIRLKYKDYYCF